MCHQSYTFCLSNMLIKAADVECRGQTIRSSLKLPPIRAYIDDMTICFMDDMTICYWSKMTTKRNWKAHHIVQDKLQCSKIEITRIKKKDKLLDNPFKLLGEYIPTIKHKPVKSLENRFDHTLKDTMTIQGTRVSVEWWLNKKDRFGLPGSYKAWILQPVVLPKIL